MQTMDIQIGKKYLINTYEWFTAPDGKDYKAVYGTVHGISSSEETLGVKTNAKSTNWYVLIGNMFIAGCQIFYGFQTNSCNFSDSESWEFVNGDCKIDTRPPKIYNVDQ